ncbi:MAG: hypothetical protein PHR16_04925 [Methylovulum sp.]|nr:hypothetical protein [Methylovulum sp.]
MDTELQTVKAQISQVFLSKPSLLTLWALSRQWRIPVVYGGLPHHAVWSRWASVFARWQGGSPLQLADGFINLDPAEPPLSLIADALGNHEDASRASNLEELIAASSLPAQHDRARKLITLWQNHKVSRYNHCQTYQDPLPLPYVLVIDQDLTDTSVPSGLADAACFQRMLDAALQENPGCQIVIAYYPGKQHEKWRGYFDLTRQAAQPRITILTGPVHPAPLLEHAQALYCVTSTAGFEGLLWGKRVRTFGMPFYAGWGLTEDDFPPPTRRQPVALENLVYAVLVAFSCYLDPETAQPCGPEQLIAWLGLQRRMRGRFPAIVYAYGFSAYKKPIVRRFFQGSHVVFDAPTEALPEHATRVAWGRRTETPLEKATDCVRLEDGFIRSVGLGADLVAPLSWALDTQGIYYDATRTSDLEDLLEHSIFDGLLIDRAKQLRTRLVNEGLTKYNVGTHAWLRPEPDGCVKNTVILVPGQVESDASLAFGAPAIRKNYDLLKAVRDANPYAYIIYKPHPDVVAGLRQAGQGEDGASHCCDEIVIDVAMAELLLQVDEVHTLTSLTGFEALLRGKKVVCYGLPFYAGWGLTSDVLVLERRTRKLALDELVAGVLILYPTYVSRTTGKFTTPERALAELLLWRENTATLLPWWRKGLRWLLKLERQFDDLFRKVG